MKALEKLSLYFDLFPDQFKQKIENEKLKLAQQKMEKQKTAKSRLTLSLRGKRNGHD